MIFSLINYLRGYLIIEANGFFIERFINLAIKSNIFLWGIKKTSKTTAVMKIRIAGFRKIRSAAFKTKTSVRILEKRGLPLYMHKHRKRKAFYIGVVLFVVILAILTSFIWSVEIVGLEKIDEKMLRDELRSCGIDAGMIKYNHSPRNIKTEMMLKIPELAWIWVDIRGTRAVVEVKERTEKPDVIPLLEPCNIIAQTDGVIMEATVKSGKAVVEIGDVVKKGDLLVSGVDDAVYDGVVTSHSIGEIYAMTWHQTKETFPLTKTVSQKTGTLFTRYSVAIGSLDIPMFPFKKMQFTSYDYSEDGKNLKLWGDLYMPVIWKTGIYEETDVTYHKMDENEALAYYSDILAEKMMNELGDGVELLKTDVSYEVCGEEITVSCTLECREEIGEKAVIYKQEE